MKAVPCTAEALCIRLRLLDYDYLFVFFFLDERVVKKKKLLNPKEEKMRLSRWESLL